MKRRLVLFFFSRLFFTPLDHSLPVPPSYQSQKSSRGGGPSFSFWPIFAHRSWWVAGPLSPNKIVLNRGIASTYADGFFFGQNNCSKEDLTANDSGKNNNFCIHGPSWEREKKAKVGERRLMAACEDEEQGTSLTSLCLIFSPCSPSPPLFLWRRPRGKREENCWKRKPRKKEMERLFCENLFLLFFHFFRSEMHLFLTESNTFSVAFLARPRCLTRLRYRNILFLLALADVW